VSQPTELAITIATLHHRAWTSKPGWLYASQIAQNLERMGFETSGRQLAATLSRMCTVDAPWLERERSPFDDYRYRVTTWGFNDLENRLFGDSVLKRPAVVDA
jgi:hypothetical protein